MTDHAIFVPFAPVNPEELSPYVELAHRLDAQRLWLGQSSASDPHHALAFAAARGLRTPIGTAVSLMPLCHPLDAALRARSIAAATGQSVVAGFGPGAKLLQGSLYGSPYRSQLGAVREYVTIVRRLLDTGKADFVGEFYSCHGRLLPQFSGPAVEIGLGVLRPGMAELAGELADVAICWLTPAAYLQNTILPALRRGAEKAERPAPRVVAIVPAALSRRGRDIRQLVLAAAGPHMRLPHYADMLSRSGIKVDAVSGAEDSADALISGGSFVYGTPDEIFTQLHAFANAGVDEIAINAPGVLEVGLVRQKMQELEVLLRLADGLKTRNPHREP
ncbi:LLM class flavin-dependent oxidoreductase [Streptomyces sp. NPDC093595]|uniref:LLM class flavin-dependent oxidoreductase n=1 Tax=Streptomyces sp. NPDC093595 TaxID=3366045 RepID=UPI003805D705